MIRKREISIFYIVVEDDGKFKLIATSSGCVREFSKRKKAQNFIDGRTYLQARNPQIYGQYEQLEIEIDETYFKVDL